MYPTFELFLMHLSLQGKDQGKMIEKPITKCDMGVQTEVHPIESNIVKSYEWNEWELRRKAIKLVSSHRKSLSCDPCVAKV